MKKLITLLLVLATCLTLAVPAAASGNWDIVTREEGNTTIIDYINAENAWNATTGKTSVRLQVGDTHITTLAGNIIQLSKPVKEVKSNFVFEDVREGGKTVLRYHYNGDCYVVPDDTTVTIKDANGAIQERAPVAWMNGANGGFQVPFTMTGDLNSYFFNSYFRVMLGPEIRNDTESFAPQSSAQSHTNLGDVKYAAGVVSGTSGNYYEEYLCIMNETAAKHVVSGSSTTTPPASGSVTVTDASMKAGQTTVTTKGGYTLTLDQPVLKAIDNFDSYDYTEHVEGSFATGSRKQPMHYIMKPGTKFKVTDSSGKDASDKVFMTYDLSEYHVSITDENFEQFLVRNTDCSIRNHYNYTYIKESDNTYTRFRFIGDYNTKAPVTEPETPTGTKPVFTDVPANAYYKKAVDWAVEQGITSGTSNTTFTPNRTCTRGEILSLLWRASGKPAVSGGLPYSDVNSGDYFLSAASWAKQKYLVEGDKFGANTPCTRQFVVYYLWRLSDAPIPKQQAGFRDMTGLVGYDDAISWAVENGITAGTSETTFSPSRTCTRAEIATFLYRYFN